MIKVSYFYCLDCRTRFNVYTKKKGKRFCPLCGDCISVKLYDPSLVKKRITNRKLWTEEEIEKLKDLLLNTNLYHKEIAHEMGRTYRSVHRKIQRLKI